MSSAFGGCVTIPAHLLRPGGPVTRSGAWWFLYNDSLHEALLQRMGASCYGYM